MFSLSINCDNVKIHNNLYMHSNLKVLYHHQRDPHAPCLENTTFAAATLSELCL